MCCRYPKVTIVGRQGNNVIDRNLHAAVSEENCESRLCI